MTKLASRISEVPKRDQEPESPVAYWCGLLLNLHCSESRCVAVVRPGVSEAAAVVIAAVRDSDKYDCAPKREYYGHGDRRPGRVAYLANR